MNEWIDITFELNEDRRDEEKSMNLFMHAKFNISIWNNIKRDECCNSHERKFQDSIMFCHSEISSHASFSFSPNKNDDDKKSHPIIYVLCLYYHDNILLLLYSVEPHLSVTHSLSSSFPHHLDIFHFTPQPTHLSYSISSLNFTREKFEFKIWSILTSIQKILFYSPSRVRSGNGKLLFASWLLCIIVIWESLQVLWLKDFVVKYLNMLQN